MEAFALVLIVVASLIYSYKTRKEGLKKGATNAELAAIRNELASLH